MSATFRGHKAIGHLLVMRFALVTAIVLITASCGPELNTPSSTSVTGKWQSSDSVSYFKNLKLDLSQTTEGDITGTWTGLLAGGNLSCPLSSTCPASNSAAGRNTVVGVSIEVLGVGKFTGQLEGSNILRGDIFRFDGDYKVTFTKIP